MKIVYNSGLSECSGVKDSTSLPGGWGGGSGSQQIPKLPVKILSANQWARSNSYADIIG